MNLFHGSDKVCEKCGARLDNNCAVTPISKIFKGTNRYMICETCGYVSLYNESLDLVFNIDKYNNDTEIMNEISEYLDMIDMKIVEPELATENNEITEEDDDILLSTEESREALNKLLEEISHSCSGDCSSCTNCSGNCDCHENKEATDYVDFNADNFILAFNPETKDIGLLQTDSLAELGDISKYRFYSLSEVEVRPVVTYEIIKK
jgi:hypothetical protein